MSITSPLIPRTLVQAIPSVTPQEFVTTLANAATRNVDYDALRATADPNLLGAGVAPTAAPLVAVGPFLDAFVFSNVALTLTVSFAISGGLFRVVSTTAVLAATFVNISGLRITGRYARVSLTNNSGGVANIELGVYVRST